MSVQARVNATCVFCDDVREEKNGMDTIVGVYSDNITVPATPGRLIKLWLYARISTPIDAVPSAIGMRIEFPWDEAPMVFSGNPLSEIEQAAELARQEGAPTVTFIMKLMFAPFIVKSPGRVRAVAIVDKEEILCGFLTFKAAASGERADALPSSPATAPSTSSTSPPQP